jgi:hypothetical protein
MEIRIEKSKENIYFIFKDNELTLRRLISFIEWDPKRHVHIPEKIVKSFLECYVQVRKITGKDMVEDLFNVILTLNKEDFQKLYKKMEELKDS